MALTISGSGREAARKGSDSSASQSEAGAEEGGEKSES